MNRLFRIAAPLIATVAIALGGASSTLAASSVTWSDPIDQAWCFDSGVRSYCFEVTGHAQYVINDAKESVVATTRLHTTFYDNDVYAGESTVTSLDRFVLSPDGTFTQQTTWHVKSELGDEVCKMQVVWLSSDFGTVVDHWSGGCTFG